MSEAYKTPHLLTKCGGSGAKGKSRCLFFFTICSVVFKAGFKALPRRAIVIITIKSTGKKKFSKSFEEFDVEHELQVIGGVLSNVVD